MRTIMTIVLTIVVVVVLGIAAIYAGVYDVAAVNTDDPVVARLVHATSERSIAVRKDAVVVPTGYDAPEKAAAGAKEYAETCVICHSGPGLKPSAIAAGINPRAPGLANSRRKPDPQEDFWIVSNGIKMTAMPGFSKSMSPDDIWNVVAFLETLPGMSAETFSQQTGLSPDTVPGGKVESGASSQGNEGGDSASASAASAAGSAPAPDVD